MVPSIRERSAGPDSPGNKDVPRGSEWTPARPPQIGIALASGTSKAAIVLVDDVQTALVVVMPFAAAAMARGLWLY